MGVVPSLPVDGVDFPLGKMTWRVDKVSVTPVLVDAPVEQAETEAKGQENKVLKTCQKRRWDTTLLGGQVRVTTQV